jgi:hypothetical protein
LRLVRAHAHPGRYRTDLIRAEKILNYSPFGMPQKTPARPSFGRSRTSFSKPGSPCAKPTLPDSATSI